MRIIRFEATHPYRYLWLKYVTGFNLNVHCARCLLGHYSSAFGYKRQPDKLADVTLDEFPCRYMYLCGVTDRWEDNLHVAFVESEGDRFTYADKYCRLEVEGARRIDILELPSYDLEKHGADRMYNTCRNWRFAYQIVHAQEIPNTI